MNLSEPNARQPTQQADLSGQRLGDYQILRRLGEGAMAEVYLAEQTSLRRQVAIKVLRSELARDATCVQRFHNEAMAAASLVHANIVQIHEVGQIDGAHFIAQEYVSGRNLGELIRRQGAVDVTLAVAVLRQVAAALHKAAQQGIVHRDIKPENILLAQSGEVKVADFGLARAQGGEGVDLTQVGMTMGTPLYMAPEQIEGRALDSRADIYALGVTCYHMLAGHPPFEGENALAVAVQHLNKPPERIETIRPDLPSGLCRIVHKMLAKKSTDRYQSARELMQELRSLQIEGDEAPRFDDLDEWSSSEMAGLDQARTAATQQLQTMMQTSAMLTPKPRNKRLLVAGILLAFLLGGAIALLVRPPSLLAGANSAPVPARQSAWGQLLHAKRTDTEAAWLSVEEHFPANDYAILLAKQGLVRHYVSVTAEYEKALPLLDELAAVGSQHPTIEAFGVAGKCLVLSLTGRKQEAADQFARLTPTMIDRLDGPTRSLLGAEMSRNRRLTGQEARRKLRHILESFAPPVPDARFGG